MKLQTVNADPSVQQNFDAIERVFPVGPADTLGSASRATPPTNPQNGQDWFYVADDAAGAQWHFKYRTSSPSTYKWEFVGGSDTGALQTAPSTQLTANVTTYTAMTNGPSMTIPFAGDYDVVHIGSTFNDTVNTEIRVQAAINGTPSSNIAWHNTIDVAEGQNSIATTRMTFAAGDTLTLMIATNNLNGYFGNPNAWRLRVRPVKVI